MPTKEFAIALLNATSPFVAATAWPICIFFVFWLFREQLRELLAQIKNLKWQGIEASFGEQVQILEGSAPAAILKAKTTTHKSNIPSTTPTIEQKQAILEIAKASPRAAIVEAWLYVEASVFDLLKRRNLLPDQRTVSIREAFAILAKHEIISSEILGFAMSAYHLRNEAAHSLEFSHESSKVGIFIDLINSLSEVLASSQ
jgi:hypothetical protein